MLDMRPIFLIGYMASGKTTLGRALARLLGREFIDLDFYISQRFHKSIPELFKEYGEEGFRDIEAAMLREAGEFEGTVIACGGGTPCFRENMDFILNRGQVIFLEASPERIIKRLKIAKTRRPLIEGKTEDELREYIDTHLSDRLPHYRRAHITIASDRLESRSQIEETLARLLPLID